MVGLFGTNDKLALEVLIVAVALLIGAGLGLLARRRYAIAAGAFVAFGVVGFVASLGEPLVVPEIAIVSTAVSVGAGLLVLGWLLDLSAAPAPSAARRDRSRRAGAVATMPDWSRRAFMIRAGGVGVAAVVAGIAGRQLLERQRVAPVGSGPPIPPASVTVPALTPDEDLSTTVANLTPIVMPNDRFYRIDTALLTPSVSTDGWTLRIHGLVDRETTLTWAQLVALPMFEQYVTIACVSNEVGDKLVGNAKWTGVRLRQVLDIAGVQSSATQLVGRSVDGFTAGMPTAWVMDPAREPMIALKMNDAPLPPIHGYPARLIVPGLYGYVSATKWLDRARAHDPRGVQRLLGAARLGQGGADPDPVADRHAARRRQVGDGPDRGHRLGSGSRRLARRGRDRRRVARCAAVEADLGRHLGPVGHRLDDDPRPAHDHGPGDRRQGRGPGGAALPAGARRCARLAHDRRGRQLSRVTAVTRRARRSGPVSV